MSRAGNPGTHGGPWTDEERERLMYAIKNAEAAQLPWIPFAEMALPNRTRPAIQVYASNRGLLRREPGSPANPLEVVVRGEYVTAWRCWRAISNGRDAVLRSVWSGEAWPAGSMLVAHDLKQYQDDGSSLKTGIHAYKTAIDPTGYGYAVPTTCVGEQLLHGTVALGGRVIEHEAGYRAQYAYPIKLFCRDRDLGRAIARSYGIEVATP